MSRIYTVEFSGVAVTAAQDFFEVAPAANRSVALHGVLVFQSSDVGDAQEEILRVRIIRGHTTSGAGGTAPTPQPLSPLDAAAGFTSEVNNTTIASAGTAVNLYSLNFNVRAGLEMWFPPEARPMASNTQGTLVVRLLAAPADSLTMAGTLIVEELI